MMLGKISYQREPDYVRVTAELISSTYMGFVARSVIEDRCL